MQRHTVMVLQFDSHRSRHIRGTITDGTDWIFLYLELNAEQTGGKYYQSIVMSVNEAESPLLMHLWEANTEANTLSIELIPLGPANERCTDQRYSHSEESGGSYCGDALLGRRRIPGGWLSAIAADPNKSGFTDTNIAR